MLRDFVHCVWNNTTSENGLQVLSAFVSCAGDSVVKCVNLPGTGILWDTAYEFFARAACMVVKMDSVRNSHLMASRLAAIYPMLNSLCHVGKSKVPSHPYFGKNPGYGLLADNDLKKGLKMVCIMETSVDVKMVSGGRRSTKPYSEWDLGNGMRLKCRGRKRKYKPNCYFMQHADIGKCNCTVYLFEMEYQTETEDTVFVPIITLIKDIPEGEDLTYCYNPNLLGKLACNQHALSMHSACTKHALSMHSACTQHAQSMHSACTYHARNMHNTCM